MGSSIDFVLLKKLITEELDDNNTDSSFGTPKIVNIIKEQLGTLSANENFLVVFGSKTSLGFALQVSLIVSDCFYDFEFSENEWALHVFHFKSLITCSLRENFDDEGEEQQSASVKFVFDKYQISYNAAGSTVRLKRLAGFYREVKGRLKVNYA